MSKREPGDITNWDEHPLDAARRFFGERCVVREAEGHRKTMPWLDLLDSAFDRGLASEVALM